MSWNPLQDLMLLQERMNRLFEDATQRRSSGEGTENEIERAEWRPKADVYETDEAFIISADLPGVDRSTMEITVDENRLILRGKREISEPANSRSERPHGTYLRTFTVPSSVDQNSIRADYRDGVLEIHLPRRKSEKKRVEIKVS